MNKKERLLEETLGAAEGAQFARQAATGIRRRRALRQAGLAAGAATVAMIATLFVTPPPAPPSGVAVAMPAPIFEIMTDQELEAQLKDQSVLLLKEHNRITGIVFLPDQAPADKL